MIEGAINTQISANTTSPTKHPKVLTAPPPPLICFTLCNVQTYPLRPPCTADKQLQRRPIKPFGSGWLNECGVCSHTMRLLLRGSENVLFHCFLPTTGYNGAPLIGGRRSMVGPELPKLKTWVRFPSPAPYKKEKAGICRLFLLNCSNKNVKRVCFFSRLFVC